MSKLPIYDMKGKAVGEYDLPDELLVFDKGLQAMHDAVVMYQANVRQGNASTKTKAEVRGTTRKLYRQKGTGRARIGRVRAPHRRGGGVAHGPRPHSFAKAMPRKVARLAFRRAVSERVAGGQLAVLEALELSAPKTAEVASMLKALECPKSVLILIEGTNENLLKAARNIPKVDVATVSSVNTYQMLRYARVLITKSALDGLQDRLRPYTRKVA